MQKQLSKKSHKQTQSSIDDFMKHIRKYNLQSQRYISPKPLLYMYTNPSKHCTIQTLQKSRSKSKTLSNRQHSNSKKSTQKTIRQKVQKMLSIGKKQNININRKYIKQQGIHKKSLSSISNKNDKSIKKLNKSTAQIDLTKSKNKLKNKLNEFKLKPMNTGNVGISNKKNKKSRSKLQQPHIKLIQTSPLKQSAHKKQRSQIMSSSIHRRQQQNKSLSGLKQSTSKYKQNPAQLIQNYSKKLFKVQLYLQSNKNKLGSMLCRKFQQILNQIVESLVLNLKKSLNQLQIDIEQRLSKQFQSQYNKSMNQKQKQIKEIQNICQKLTKKFGQLLHKQHYANSLIYNLRLKGIDIDNQFGKAVWNVDNLGGLGYGKTQTVQYYQQSERDQQNMQNQLQEYQDSPSTHRGPINKKIKLNRQIQQSEQEEYEFIQHPKSQRKRYKQQQEIKQIRKKQQNLTLMEQQEVEQLQTIQYGQSINRQLKNRRQQKQKKDKQKQKNKQAIIKLLANNNNKQLKKSI